jgi:murein DD-endopeptidase MepM/ murein hydrolase activator NlpD
VSEIVWEPGQSRQAHTGEPQIDRPDFDGQFLTSAADAIAPLSRRAAREQREQEAAAAATTSRIRSRRAAPASAGRRSSRRPNTRPASVLPKLAKPKLGGRAMLTKLMTFSAMAGVAGILVATSVPANALYQAAPQDAALQQQSLVHGNVEVQSIGVEDAPEVAKTQARDAYTVVSLSDQLRGRYGTDQFTFTNNPNGTIQWPFATGVPISSGYGARSACSFCSSNHLGVDFVPGLGAPIQAIADGVVREVNVSGGPLGVNIIIDHEINGQKVTSVYAHMLWGSPAVAAGQAVTVAQYLGDVGNTGNSTGPHLHLEIHVDEKPVDPFVWLKANAN